MHVIYVISCHGRKRSAYLCGPPSSCSFHSSVYWPECLKVLGTFFSWFLGPARSLCILHPTRRLSKLAACPQAHPRGYFAIYVAQGLCFEVCKLLGSILGSHVMVLLLQDSNSCPIYSEFLTLSQLFPLHTSGLGLGNWTSSQRQSIANLSHSRSASLPPLEGKKSTSRSIHEDIILTLVTLSLLLWLFI